MHNLSRRLQMVLRSVPRNSAVADIGTDHAFLPIALISYGIASRVIACDVAEGPLAVAERNVKKSGVKGIELRLSDGLQRVQPHEVDVVTIAGMGGDLIARILTAAEWVKNPKKRLILQAMTSADSLRDYLFSEGFDIIEESAVTDSGRVYSVITAEFSGKVKVPKESERLIGGLVNDPSADATQYIEIQLKRIEKCARSIKNVSRKAQEYIAAETAAAELREILKDRNN